MIDQNVFDGCYRKCRIRREHTLEYGGCEHADKPEPTVSMSKVFTDTDGHPSIGYDQYTVQQLADLIESALRDADTEVSADHFPDLAQAAARAIVHRNDTTSSFEVTLQLAEFQTCRVCGAGNRVGAECTACAFQIRMDTETCQHDAERHGPEAGCIECRCVSTTGHGADGHAGTTREMNR
ncbi:hypothetical protein ACFW2V_13210 [Streptomyces sp. NPDC058947]|uniref:hypothetical protein n=1 Tax=Streptomyces sp. NPDC058947 TaxID=3346675 RepID=UPI0036A2EBB9